MVLWSPGVCSCLCWPSRGLGLSREDIACRLQKRKISVSCPVREYTQRSRHTCPSLTETDPGHCSSVAGTHELHLIVGRRHNDAHVKHLQRGGGQSHHKGREEPRLLLVTRQHTVLQHPSRDGLPDDRGAAEQGVEKKMQFSVGLL